MLSMNHKNSINQSFNRFVQASSGNGWPPHKRGNQCLVIFSAGYQGEGKPLVNVSNMSTMSEIRAEPTFHNSIIADRNFSR